MRANIFGGVLAGAAVLFAAGAAGSAERLPIFDAHVHYSAAAWPAYSIATIKNKFEAAGVTWALVSSSPDEGTLKLKAADPGRVVAELRPYHGAINSGTWLKSPAILGYLKDKLATNAYVGIGEFHVFGVDGDEIDTLADVAALALARSIIVHVHSGAAAVEQLFALEPKLTVLWAHAGMSEPADVVEAMMAKYPRLYADTSFRAGDIAPGGQQLDARWRAVLTRFPDRFLIGTDTYANTQWESYGSLIAASRAWLDKLPREIAVAIAYKNALALFGMTDRDPGAR
jgi:hypothetical protein